MNKELAQLRDIHLPPPISWWPLAPGWYVVISFVVITFGALLYMWYQRRQRKYTVKYALKKLKQLESCMHHNPENINIAAEISILIRRTALYYFHREDIAGLSGNEWLYFLNRSGKTNQFTQETGRLLTDAPYQKNNMIDPSPLFQLTQRWLTTISKNKRIVAEK